MARVRDDRDDTELVLAARAGEGDAFGVLFDRWFDRVWDVAWRIVRDREVASEVAQDVFVVAWQRLSDLREPGSFGGWLLRTSRNRALNRLERERRSTPAGGTDEPVLAALPSDRPDPATVVDDRGRDELVWAAAAALGERDASVLDLHLRHGLAPAEIAEALDVAPNHAHQLLFRLKDRLGTAIRSWVLWRHGSPRCHELTAVLAGAGVAGFGPDAVRVIGRHAGGCDECTAARNEVLAPERLFAVVPIALAPPLLKAKAAAALDAAGVPMSGSEGLASSADDGSTGDGSDGEAPDADGSGQPGPDGPGAGAPTTPRSRRGRVLVAGGVAAAVVVALVVVVALAGGAGDDDEPDLAVDDESSTTGDDESSDEATSTSRTSERTTTTSTPTTAEASTSTPAAVGTDPEPTEPRSGTTLPSTTTTSSSTTTTATDPPPPPPEPTISGFRARTDGGACGRTPGAILEWQSSDGTSHTITAPDGSTFTVEASGARTECRDPFGIWTLTVTGPGGTATATATF